MDGKANLPVSHKKPPQDAIVQHAMAMNVDEAGGQEAYNKTQELMAAPNSKEVVVSSDATSIADIVEVGTQDATMHHQEQVEQQEEEMEVDDDDYDDDEDDYDEDEEEEEGFHYFVPVNNEQGMDLAGPQAMHWFFLTGEAAEAPHAVDGAGQGGIRFHGPVQYVILDDDEDEEEDYMVHRAGAFPLETRIQATGMGWPNTPVNDPIPIQPTSQYMFNNSESQVVFVPGMEEETDNDWYDSIAHDAQMMEQMEDPGIDGLATPLQLPRSEAPKEDPSAEEASPELSLQDISKMWGLHPDEPGPSTRSQTRVPPLADDEVAKFNCGICLETLPIFDLFHGMLCPHKFCVVCMVKYIKGRTRAGEVPIPCPDPSCKEEGNDSILNPEDCKKSIDFDVFCAWTNLLTENAIPPNQRVYCPNRECRVMLEMVESTCANKTPSKAPCPACRHLMCVTCRMGWSTDGSGQHDCTEGPEAELVRQLATERRWKQCPRCRYYVERTTGCDVMTCRCRAVFCYTCGHLMLQVLGEGGEMCQCRN